MGLLPLLDHSFFLARYRDLSTSIRLADELIERIHTASAVIPSPDSVQLVSLLHSVGGRAKPWGGLIKAMLDGTLRFTITAGTKPLMARVLVCEEDLKRHTGTSFEKAAYPHFRFESHMTKRDAGEILNLTPREHTKLFKNIPTTNQRLLSVADVEALAVANIAAIEIAVRSGRSTKFVYAEANRIGVPATAAGFDRELGEKVLLPRCI